MNPENYHESNNFLIGDLELDITYEQIQQSSLFNISERKSQDPRFPEYSEIVLKGFGINDHEIIAVLVVSPETGKIYLTEAPLSQNHFLKTFKQAIEKDLKFQPTSFPNSVNSVDVYSPDYQQFLSSQIDMMTMNSTIEGRTLDYYNPEILYEIIETLHKKNTGFFVGKGSNLMLESSFKIRSFAQWLSDRNMKNSEGINHLKVVMAQNFTANQLQLLDQLIDWTL